MLRVLVVDDEALVRSGLQMILGSAADIEVVATCDGSQAIEQARRHRPDVVLLDIRMPEVDGLTVLRELSRWPRPPAVAMLTTFDADEFVAEALRSGAAGFLLKDTEPGQLVQAVRALADGGSVLSPTVARTVITGYLDGASQPTGEARTDRMSPREREVLSLVGLGLSNAEIGSRLHLSTATVKDYVSAVLVKAGRDQSRASSRDRPGRRPAAARRRVAGDEDADAPSPSDRCGLGRTCPARCLAQYRP